MPLNIKYKVQDCTWLCTTCCLLIRLGYVRVRVGLCLSPNRKCNPVPHSNFECTGLLEVANRNKTVYKTLTTRNLHGQSVATLLVLASLSVHVRATTLHLPHIQVHGNWDS